jgi:hypothetical protein
MAFLLSDPARAVGSFGVMPMRIRSNGCICASAQSGGSTTIAAVFLPTVGKYGYSTMFFAFVGFTVIYFVTAAFFLPGDEREKHRGDRVAFQRKK